MSLIRNSHYYIATTDEGLLLGTIQDNSIMPESEAILKFKSGIIASWIESGLIVSRVDSKSLIRALRSSHSLLPKNNGKQQSLALIPKAEDFTLIQSEPLWS